jgi:general secretion pathway protein L
MSLLVILPPPRTRLAAARADERAADGDGSARLPAEIEYVFSTDARSVASSGRAPAALLPRADSTVVVLAETDVAWHLVEVPKASAARLRAALAGVLEEALLDETDALHLALGPGAAPGQRGFVAVMHRPWLLAWLSALESAGRPVDRVLPMSRPLPAAAAGSDPASTVQGHFFDDAADSEAEPWLALSRSDGVWCTRLAGAFARSLLPAPGPDTSATWTATPAAAAAAERFVGSRVAVRTTAERALDAARDASGFNLRQFDMAPRRRGTRAVAELGRRLMGPAWRPARWGVAAFVAVQLVGLNAYAWQQREAVAQRKQAMVDLLKATHPGVRAVLDAPVQMQRETERLRAAAGRTGDADLESLLAAASAAWPDGQGPVQTLRFESGRLTLAATGWADQQVQQFQQRLLAAGYRAEFAEGRLTVTPVPA